MFFSCELDLLAQSPRTPELPVLANALQVVHVSAG